MRRLLGRERGRRHPGLRVELEQDQPVRPAALVPAEVAPRDAAAAEAAVRPQGLVEAGVADRVGDCRRDHVPRAAGAVFGVVVVPAVGLDVGDGKCPVAHHRDGELPPRNVALDHHDLGHLGPELRRPVRRLVHEVDADRRSLVVGLHDIGRLHHVPRPDLRRAGEPAFGHRQPLGAERRLRTRLVHGERRGEHARMGVGQPQPLEQPLHATILAPAAVERVKNDIGVRFGKPRGQVEAGVDLRHLETLVPQRGRAAFPRREGDLALGGGPAQEDGHLAECPARHSHVSASSAAVYTGRRLCEGFAHPHDLPL